MPFAYLTVNHSKSIFSIALQKQFYLLLLSQPFPVTFPLFFFQVKLLHFVPAYEFSHVSVSRSRPAPAVLPWNNETVNDRAKMWHSAHEIWKSPTKGLMLTMGISVFKVKCKIHFFCLVLCSVTPHL